MLSINTALTSLIALIDVVIISARLFIEPLSAADANDAWISSFFVIRFNNNSLDSLKSPTVTSRSKPSVSSVFFLSIIDIAERIVFDVVWISSIVFPYLSLILLAASLSKLSANSLKLLLILRIILSKPLLILVISNLNVEIFLIISFLFVSSVLKDSSLRVISVSASFWDTTSFEKTARFVAITSNNFLISVDLRASSLSFTRVLIEDSISANLETTKPCLSSILFLTSPIKSLSKSAFSSRLRLSILLLIAVNTLSTPEKLSTPCALIELIKFVIFSKFVFISSRLLISAISKSYFVYKFP